MMVRHRKYRESKRKTISSQPGGPFEEIDMKDMSEPAPTSGDSAPHLDGPIQSAEPSAEEAADVEVVFEGSA